MSTFLGVTDEVDTFHRTDRPGKYKDIIITFLFNNTVHNHFDNLERKKKEIGKVVN